jgi:hypothetical protein
LGRGGGASGSGAAVLGELVASGAGVAADRGNQLVTVGWLRDGDATLVGPSLQVGIGPALIEPISRVGSSLAELVGDVLVVLTSAREEGVAGVRLRIGNTIAVKEGLELGIRPTACGKVSMIELIGALMEG